MLALWEPVGGEGGFTTPSASVDDFDVGGAARGFPQLLT